MADSRYTQQLSTGEDKIDFYELARVLWAGKWLIGGITVALTVVAIIIALTLPSIYRAEALLAPNDQEGAGGFSQLSSRYGDLASLAGINLGNNSVDKTAVGLEILKSRKFITEFIERHDLLVPLMAAKGWDESTGELRIDAKTYNAVTGKWVRQVKPLDKAAPSSQEAFKRFNEIFSVNQDKNTGFVTISIEHYSPILAKQWVDWIIEDINLWIMRKDVEEAEQAIAFLNKQISNTALTDLQTVFFRLIEEQTKTIMLAEASSEYLLETLDPAVVPELRSKPKRRLIVAIAVVLGGVFGVSLELIRTRIASVHARRIEPE